MMILTGETPRRFSLRVFGLHVEARFKLSSKSEPIETVAPKNIPGTIGHGRFIYTYIPMDICACLF